MEALLADINAQAAARKYYKHNPIDFIEDWCVTLDPRNAGSDTPTFLPMILFDRQRDLVRWLVDRIITNPRDGLVEKTRDMGATWVCAQVSVWLWLYWDETAIGWGSMSKSDVDNLGDPSSIFEKMRVVITHLPDFLLPVGFGEKEHLTSMRCVNPANGATITGDVGDNIGRGGRTTVYFKDESAHYERAEKIEAALGDNTNAQIDISSVNGEGTVFHKRRMSLPEDDVFILDWRDHPAKTEEWYKARKQKYSDMGLEHLHAQEVDRDYAAAVQGVCIPSAWVKAAVGLELDDCGELHGGLDVATEDGSDLNALTLRKGPTVLRLEKDERTWSGLDGTQTGHKCDAIVLKYGGIPGETVTGYDGHGVGAQIAAPAKTSKTILYPVYVGSKKLPGLYDVVLAPGVEETDEAAREVRRIKNKDMFLNKKAKLWWDARERFRRTWQYVNEGIEYDHGDLVSLPIGSDALQMQLSQPRMFQNDAGQRKLESKDQLRARGISSPDEAESFILSYDTGYKTSLPSMRRM